MSETDLGVRVNPGKSFFPQLNHQLSAQERKDEDEGNEEMCEDESEGDDQESAQGDGSGDQVSSDLGRLQDSRERLLRLIQYRDYCFALVTNSNPLSALQERKLNYGKCDNTPHM